MKTPLEELVAGNRRYVSGHTQIDPSNHQDQRQSLVSGQQPFAVILACSDSRVPTETIFDQGLGDVFVIRVAGNVATTTQIGSVEYAVAVLGSPLVVVLGHAQCGAVAATMDAMAQPGEGVSEHVGAIISQIRPALEPLVATTAVADLSIEDAVKANVERSVAQLLGESRIIEDKVNQGELQVIGACYDLASGEVQFYD